MKTGLSEKQKKLAELSIKSGLNLQKGQRLAINCPVECVDFARECARVAYDIGCREVIMLWYDDVLDRMKFLSADNDIFDKVNEWDKLQRDIISEEGCAWLAIYAEDPEKLKGVEPDRITRYQKARGKAYDEFYKREERNDFQWCVVSVPTVAWAKAVFPDLDEEMAVERLWDEILKACRVDDCDAISAWKTHSDELQKHVKMLNDFNFKSLHYKNSIGTDFTVELPKGHYWAGGEEDSAKGIPFSANIPTEEVFVLPARESGNGKIVASKPLCINGNIIDNFSFLVENGKITEVHAEKGEEILKDAISVDEGASYFGELALVPYDSPISNSGVLFLNTLFDENASCHIAFGSAYPNVKGAEGLEDDELKALGINVSMTHEDFMIGTADLSIVGTTWDGKEVPVFIDGNFAF